MNTKMSFFMAPPFIPSHLFVADRPIMAAASGLLKWYIVVRIEANIFIMMSTAGTFASWLAAALSATTAFFTFAFAAQHLHLFPDDLGDVAVFAVAVLPFSGLQV